MSKRKRNRFGRHNPKPGAPAPKKDGPSIVGMDGTPMTAHEPEAGTVCPKLSQPIFLPTAQGPLVTLAKIQCIGEQCALWDPDARAELTDEERAAEVPDPLEGCLLRHAAEAGVDAQEDSENLVRAAAQAGLLELEDEDEEDAPVEVPPVPDATAAELEPADGDPLERDTVELPKVVNADDTIPPSPIVLP